MSCVLDSHNNECILTDEQCQKIYEIKDNVTKLINTGITENFSYNDQFDCLQASEYRICMEVFVRYGYVHCLVNIRYTNDTKLLHERVNGYIISLISKHDASDYEVKQRTTSNSVYHMVNLGFSTMNVSWC